MVLLANLGLFLAACLVLVFSGSFLVRSITKIAMFLRMSEFVIGFIVMALATSLPELFVGITAALAKTPALALGTVIGSNIADLALVGGIIVLLGRTIFVKAKIVKNDAIWMIILITLPMVMMFIRKGLGMAEGIFLLAVFIFYSVNLVRRRQKRPKFVNNVKKWDVVLSSMIFLVALVALFMSAKYVVEYGSLIAAGLSLPPLLIGLFFVAIGTSLPEIVFGATAVLKHHPQMVLGVILGSVIANSTLVLGVTAILHPIQADFVLWLVSAVFMLVIAFVFFVFMHSGRRLDWREGIALLLLYFLFVIVELTVKGVIGG